MNNSYTNFLKFLIANPGTSLSLLAELKTSAGAGFESAKPLAADGEETQLENRVREIVGGNIWLNELLRKLFVAVQPQLPAFYGRVVPAAAGAQPLTQSLAMLKPEEGGLSQSFLGFGPRAVAPQKATYLDWLRALIKLREKLPAILAAIEVLFNALGDMFPPAPAPVPAIPGAPPDSLQLVTGTTATTAEGEKIYAEVLEAESMVMALQANPDGDPESIADDARLQVRDGSRLRNIFKFLQDSGILDALLGAVLKKAAGG